MKKEMPFPDVLKSLEVSEQANKSFDFLLTELADLMHEASLYRARGFFDPSAMIEYSGRLELVIKASGFDARVIKMCQVMLGLTCVSEQEFALDNSGTVRRRQVYFVKRSDGLIKIGSSMWVSRRLEQLSAGAAEDLKLIGHVDGSTLFEKRLHESLSEHRKYGEWFYPSPEVIACISKVLAINHRYVTHS